MYTQHDVMPHVEHELPTLPEHLTSPCKNKKGGIYALQNHIEERQTTQWSKEKGQQ
jgi:hypothetical protein